MPDTQIQLSLMHSCKRGEMSNLFTFCVFMRKVSGNYFKKNLPYCNIYVISIQSLIVFAEVPWRWLRHRWPVFCFSLTVTLSPAISAIYMNSIKSMALVAALASGFALSASAAMPLSTVNVPDSGATVMFLGVALAGLALMRHYLRR